MVQCFLSGGVDDGENNEVTTASHGPRLNPSAGLHLSKKRSMALPHLLVGLLLLYWMGATNTESTARVVIRFRLPPGVRASYAFRALAATLSGHEYPPRKDDDDELAAVVMPVRKTTRKGWWRSMRRSWW